MYYNFNETGFMRSLFSSILKDSNRTLKNDCSINIYLSQHEKLHIVTNLLYKPYFLCTLENNSLEYVGN